MLPYRACKALLQVHVEVIYIDHLEDDEKNGRRSARLSKLPLFVYQFSI
jgi:hypothetical protein